MKPWIVRPETSTDRAAIDALLVGAFPGPGEAALVSALRASSALSTSLVAEQDGAIVGHVAFSPVEVGGSPAQASGLGPLAVDARRRRLGIGEALVRAGLDARRAAGDRLVVVLGEPAYYGRFGFGPASSLGLRSVYDAGDAFQAVSLVPSASPVGAGLVTYAGAFDLVEDGPEPAAARSHLALIFAIDEDGALGRDGEVPWDLPEDRAHFERATRGHTVIMGRRTWEETGRPLPGRRNVVVTSRAAPLDGAVTAPTLEQALAAVPRDDAMPFVIGGARLFEAALPRATRIYETCVPGRHAADVFMKLDLRDFEEVAAWPGSKGERYRVLARRAPPTSR